MELEIGKIYSFDYESMSKKPKKDTKISVQMKPSIQESLISFVKDNALSSLNRFNEKNEFAKRIVDAKGKAAKDELKKEFKETFASDGIAPNYVKAQNLFFRAYKPENMDFNADGKGGVSAVFAGWNVTVTGKVTYKWYVLSQTTIEAKSYNEDVSDFIIVYT